MSYGTPPSAIKETRRRRLLINGLSGSWKTGCLVRTAPRPMAFFNFPGELGFSTVPDGQADIAKLAYTEPQGKKVSSLQISQEVEKTALDLVASGKYTTLVFEGLHHMAQLDLDIVTDGAFFRGEDFEPVRYAGAYRRTLQFLDRLCNTMTPVVIFTCWADQRPIRPKKKGENIDDIPKKWYSMLPGQLGFNLIKGRFDIMAYQTLKAKKDKNGVTVKNARGEKEYEAFWQIKEDDHVFCAGLKGDPNITERMPAVIPASYQALEEAWAKAEKDAAGG